MAAHFYNITIQEMHHFLASLGFQRIELPNTFEAVYGKRVDQGHWPLTLRVYTGINPNGQSRNRGEDAMHVALFLRKPDGSIVKLGGSKRVHRVQNWQNNLRARIEGWTDYLPKHSCPLCNLPMIVRQGKKGPFLACSGFPTCEHTQSVQ